MMQHDGAISQAFSANGTGSLGKAMFELGAEAKVVRKKQLGNKTIFIIETEMYRLDE